MNNDLTQPITESEDLPDNVHGGVAFGEALETARVRLGYSLETASEVLRVTPRTLGQIESGLRTPTDAFIATVCGAYGLEQDRLGTRGYVPRTAPYLSDDASVLWLGWLPISLPEQYSTEGLICSIASTLRSMRSLDVHQPVYLRAGDLGLIASLLDIEDPDLVRVMITHLKITLSEAIDEVQRMQAVLNAEDPLDAWRSTEHHVLATRSPSKSLQRA